MALDENNLIVLDDGTLCEDIIRIGNITFYIIADETKYLKGPHYFDSLPDDVILIMMQYLAKTNALDLIRFGNTSQRMYNLSCSPLLWVDVQAQQFTKWSELAGLLPTRLSFGTRKLDLGKKMLRCDRLDKRKKCPELFRSCPRLKELCLRNSDLSLRELRLLPRNLRTLTLSDARQSIRSKDYCQGLKHLRHLQKLNLIFHKHSHIEGGLNCSDVQIQLEKVLPKMTQVTVELEENEDGFSLTREQRIQKEIDENMQDIWAEIIEQMEQHCED